MEFIYKFTPFVIPGLIYGIGTLGLALTFKFLKFPDFTILGSIMVGGIVCIYTSNFTTPVLGIIIGSLSGTVLGMITGILISVFKIQPVLAGIVVYTGSYSIGYSLTSGGAISYNSKVEPFISPIFTIDDSIILLMISIIICISFSFLIKTTYGSLLLAMSGSKDFLKYRHRYKNIILISTLMYANTLVGLAGSLYALKDRSAYVISHSEFLPIALGAMFGGMAISVWISNKLVGSSLNFQLDTQKQRIRASPIVKFLGIFFNAEKQDSRKIGILFFSYVIGAVFLKEIQGLVHSKAFFDISFNLSHFIIALLIIISVWWAGIKETS